MVEILCPPPLEQGQVCTPNRQGKILLKQQATWRKGESLIWNYSISHGAAEKTTAMIKLAAATGGLIITVDSERAAFVQKLANELGIRIVPPMGIEAFLSQKLRRGRFPKTVYVDDADGVLQRLLQPCVVEAISVTDYNERPLFDVLRL